MLRNKLVIALLVLLALSVLGPVLIGRDPFDIAGAHVAMNRAIAASFSTGMPIAKAGIDLALHDLAGKLLGKPVTALWGRKRGRG